MNTQNLWHLYSFCKGLCASLKPPLLPPSPGLCGSMNFDEASDQEDDTEEERTRSLSPKPDTTRPSSAASGKDTPVSRRVIPLAVHKTPLPGLNLINSLFSGGGNSGIAHSRQRADRRGQSRGVCLPSGSARRHRQMSNHPGQEGHGPRPLPHLLHAHGERGRQESECVLSDS